MFATVAIDALVPPGWNPCAPSRTRAGISEPVLKADRLGIQPASSLSKFARERAAICDDLRKATPARQRVFSRQDPEDANCGERKLFLPR